VLEPISSERGSVEEMEAEEKVRNPKENEGLCIGRAGAIYIWVPQPQSSLLVFFSIWLRRL
jgi:hypothetical protein